ncbi:Acyl-CoA dehydrogenase [Frankia canadensis]|uniref:Acyl-CoA dehydrogenase n=1 Tax=Frankia canadensis TaxID=1836972 RepID=A0A2I2L2T0_9ACTN|nr:acyl-CoA dehydrogenase family protein [Frankia canadensis]SNQ52233.1 Acyl-CoA dehydrogenase [Frankia canadensis]SOU59523.1 Acyl-CoA dehydrogenase [Frankia canadensis]
MDFAFTEEQEELRRTVADVLTDLSTETDVRRLMATDEGFDRKLWSQFAEIGLLGLAIPEELGGAGYGLLEVGVVLEEAGRTLLCAPYLSTVVLATTTLLTAGDEAAAAKYLPQIAEGTLISTLALTEESGRWDREGVTVSAAQGGGDTWTLDGVKTFVVDGHTADLLIVVAVTGDEIGLFLVDADAAGLTRALLPTMDQTRKWARLEFAGTPARRLGSGDAWPTVEKVLRVAATALAAEQVGGAARTVEMAAEYAKIREQFGRPIGSFQAIKHICADMLVQLEAARSAAYYALWAGATDSDEFPLVSSIAKACCSDAYYQCTTSNIQVHGGIGFTWEHPAHLYFKRAKASQLLFGDPALHRELVAQHIGI